MLIYATVTETPKRNGQHRLTISDPINIDLSHAAPGMQACIALADAGYGDDTLVCEFPDGRERWRMPIGHNAKLRLTPVGEHLCEFIAYEHDPDDPFAWAKAVQRYMAKRKGD